MNLTAEYPEVGRNMPYFVPFWKEIYLQIGKILVEEKKILTEKL